MISFMKSSFLRDRFGATCHCPASDASFATSDQILLNFLTATRSSARMNLSVPVYQFTVIVVLTLLPLSITATRDGKRRCSSTSVFCFDMDEDGNCRIGSNASQTFDQSSLIFSLTLQRSITFADVYSWTLRFNDSLANFSANVSMQQADQKIELQVRKNNGSKALFSVCFDNCMKEGEERMADFFLRRDKDDSNAIVLQSTPRVGKQIGLSHNQFTIAVIIITSPGKKYSCPMQPPVSLMGHGTNQAKGRPMESIPMVLGLGILTFLTVASIVVASFLAQNRRRRWLMRHRRKPVATVRSSNRLTARSNESESNHLSDQSSSAGSAVSSSDKSQQGLPPRSHRSHEKAPSRHTSRQTVPLHTSAHSSGSHGSVGAHSDHSDGRVSPSRRGA